MGNPGEAKEKEKKSFGEQLSDGFHAFGNFIYDSDEGTVMGRDGRSWVRILIFYAFYYAFLACLFAIAITVTLNTLDPNVPYFQTRVQTPGVTIQPKLPSKESLEKDIKYKMSDENSYAKYVNRLNVFLEPYDIQNQTDDNFWKNCSGPVVEVANINPYAKACRFNRDQLGLCAGNGYGYKEGKPCVLVKVNRIINWFPVSYPDISNEAADSKSVSKAPPLVDVLAANGEQYNNELMYVSCYGLKDEDIMNLNGETAKASSQTRYYPAGIPFSYYPYYGKNRQGNYISPIVGVQFRNVTKGVEISVGCKAYSRNIRDSERINQGFIHFKLQIDE